MSTATAPDADVVDSTAEEEVIPHAMKPPRLTDQFAVRLDLDAADLVRAVAVAEGRSPASVIRRAVLADLPSRITPDAATAPTTDLALRPASREVLMPLDTTQVVAGMQAYQQMLPQLLDASDYQDAGRGKRFVKKSGWRKIARAFNLSTAIVSVIVIRDDAGMPVRAEAIVRAIAPNGQISDGDGYCAADEDRFKDASGRKKLENDLRATATTRAKNRAISDLVGMGEVSAEEAEAATSSGHGAPADQKLGESAHRALVYLLGNDAGNLALSKIMQRFGDELPAAAAYAIADVAKAHKDLTTTTDAPADADAPPEGDTPA